MQRLRIAHLHQPGGWLSPGFVEIGDDGIISRVLAAAPPEWEGQAVERLDGFVVPGALNVHSHAHQRGLAGRAEGGSGATDAENFWRWRERMYAFVLSLSPDDFQAIATWAFIEMLRAGYTTVGEFHYLHHDRDGAYYADPAEMSARVLAAADEAGIALTLLPSLYTHGGVGKPPAPEQRRFNHRTVDDFLDLVARLRAAAADRPLVRVGVAPHSLRAVSAAELAALLDGIDSATPVHIHVAEQTGEVEECLQALGTTPASWLDEHVALGPRWTFIHATHCTTDELRALARYGVVVSLCPLTEANLGDGVFPMIDYDAFGGRWGIGSDSNIIIDPAQELRTIENVQRLVGRRRRVLTAPGDPTTEQPGRRLYDLALAGGAQALAQPTGALTPGHRADLLELDPGHPTLVGQAANTVLDGWLLTGDRAAVRQVMVGGRWVVRDGQHPQQAASAARFAEIMRRLWK